MVQASLPPTPPGILTAPPAAVRDRPGGPVRGPLAVLGATAAAAFAVLFVHALLISPTAPGSLDLRLMFEVQQVEVSRLEPVLDRVDDLTESEGAVRAWLVTMIGFAALRWWLPALAVASLPLGGVINETISRLLVPRTRPDVDGLRYHADKVGEPSFPSGHVVGAILLYGLIWYVASRRVRFLPLRWAVQAACGAVVVLSGFERVWDGHHWPTDVFAAWALGLALLAALILACEWIEHAATGIVLAGAPRGPILRSSGVGRMVAPVAGLLIVLLLRYPALASAMAGPPARAGDRSVSPPRGAGPRLFDH